MGRKANSLRDSEIAANQRELAAGLIPSGRIRLWPQRRLHSRAMGVMLRPEFNKRKEVIQCRVGPWRWWWQADAEPAGSEQFRAEWLHSATRKLRATKTWQPPFRLGRARGLAAPPAQPSQFSRKAAVTRPSLWGCYWRLNTSQNRHYFEWNPSCRAAAPENAQDGSASSATVIWRAEVSRFARNLGARLRQPW